VSLAVDEVKNVPFSWNLAGVPDDTIYTVKANATIDGTLLDEFVNGQVKIRLHGDVNGNGAANVLDMLDLKIAISLGKTPQQCPFCDINCNGAINVLDMLDLKIILST